MPPDEKFLAKAQRKLSKADKATPEQKKARKIVARIHELIANRQLNFAHQTSHQLVDWFGTIVFEDLNISNMQKNHYLAKSIADVTWNMFISITRNKAEEAGSCVILVNPRNTSQCDRPSGRALENRKVRAVLRMWEDRRKNALRSSPFLPALWAGDGSGPECGGQYYEIGTAISGLKNPGCPRLQSGEQSQPQKFFILPDQLQYYLNISSIRPISSAETIDGLPPRIPVTVLNAFPICMPSPSM